MSEVFKGWRRKVGCVTLLLTCVYMGGWLRTRMSSDQITIQFKNSSHVFRLTGGHFQWIHHTGVFPNDPAVTWQSWKAGLPLDHPELSMEFDSRLHWSGFEFGRGRVHDFMPQEFLIIPCLSVAIPLILASAYLLLAKHRSTFPNRTVEA